MVLLFRHIRHSQRHTEGTIKHKAIDCWEGGLDFESTDALVGNEVVGTAFQAIWERLLWFVSGPSRTAACRRKRSLGR